MRPVLVVLTLAATVLLGACGSSSPLPASSATRSAARSHTAASTPAFPSSSDDQPQRHTKLAHATCVLEVVVRHDVRRTDHEAGDRKIARTLGMEYDALVDETLPAVMTPLHPVDLSKAAGRRAAQLAGTNCKFGANPADDLPNEVLTRPQLAKLRALLPADLSSVLAGIHYYG